MTMLNTPVGEIAATLPGATAIFRRHKIDFCCGGGNPLRAACEAKGINTDAIVAEINALQAKQAPSAGWSDAALPDLISHILTAYHEKHRRDLPELIRLAARVEAVHGNHPACPHGLAEALRETQRELELHMQKEEQILFPMINRGMTGMVAAPISVMRHEHDEHGDRLRTLEALAHHFELPEGACNTWRATYSGVKAFIDDVMEHIHLENNVLFLNVLGQR